MKIKELLKYKQMLRETPSLTEEEYHLQLANNKAVAEFMEYEKVYRDREDWDEYRIPDQSYEDNNTGFNGEGTVLIDTFLCYELKYHLLYDWLMPVVDRIESLYVNKEKYRLESIGNQAEFILLGRSNSNGSYSNEPTFDDYKEDNKLTAIYMAVLRFIKWYNKTKK